MKQNQVEPKPTQAGLKIPQLWVAAVVAGWLCIAWSGGLLAQNPPWPRFAIDDSLRGADGARLADANADGLPDIVTGWEESGLVRIYLHPGKDAVTQVWPNCTVGSAPSVEDAVWVDLNQDGQLDVLASCEGSERSLRCFIAPGNPKDLLTAELWRMEKIEAADQLSRWMFALPVPNAMRPELLIVGSKDPNGLVGMLPLSESQDIPKTKVRKLADAGWIMSIQQRDVDGDGDMDILYSDRKGDGSGVHWLERSNTPGATWTRHLLGAEGEEVMFLACGPAPSAGRPDGFAIYVAAKPNRILRLSPSAVVRDPWQVEEVFAADPTKYGRAKAVAAGDLTGDGLLDLVYSCESADPPLNGVVLLTQQPAGQWLPEGVSGPEGIKFDLIQLVDLDQDGDLDILTCEERHEKRGLGLIWYQNPSEG